MDATVRHVPRRRRRHERPPRSISSGAPLGLRLRVFVTRVRLDRQIATGVPCASPAARALRLRQLTDPGARQRVARDLRGIVDHVDHLGCALDLSASVIHRGAVSAGREAILGLADRLEAAAPVGPRGVALARALLTEGTSPLYNPHSRMTVAQAIWEVADVLEAEAPFF